MSWTRQTSRYDVGDKPRVTCTFTDVDTSSQVDPGKVYCEVTNPDNTKTTYEYGVGTEIVRDSIGVYHIDVYLDQAGRWTVRWYSKQSAEAASVHYLIAVQ